MPRNASRTGSFGRRRSNIMPTAASTATATTAIAIVQPVVSVTPMTVRSARYNATSQCCTAPVNGFEKPPRRSGRMR